MFVPPESSFRQAVAFLSHLPGRWFGWPWWSGYGLALVIPLTALTYLMTGPWSVVASLMFTLPLWLLVAFDFYGPDEVRHVPIENGKWLFDSLLYLLAGLHLVNLVAMGHRIAGLTFENPEAIEMALVQLVVIRILLGTACCTSAIAPAHELIHRPSKFDRMLGRLLLMTVFHDPFFYAHRIGHHAALGCEGDPSTPRSGEDYKAFFWRSVQAQWGIAWAHSPSGFLKGLVVEAVLAGVYGWVFGPLALFAWVYVSAVGLRLLEAVNYFQHYGLGSLNQSGQDQRAWGCRSGVSLMLFLGLTRHEAHHRQPRIPYQSLEDVKGGAILPMGYLGMAFWVKNTSRSFMVWADAHLERTVSGTEEHKERKVQCKSSRALA